jgi:hypothetical protein
MIVVDWRPGWVEASARAGVDRLGMRILAVVRTERCENHRHRKGKGSLTMQISQGLIDPNRSRKSSKGKGKQVNIPVLS